MVYDTPIFQILAFYLDFGGAKEMSFKSWCGALNDAWCSWLGFGIFILIWLWSLVFIHHWFKSLLSFLILKVQRHLDLDSIMVTGLWHTHDPNFCSLSWFWRCKEHSCSLSPHMGLWRTLEAPDSWLLVLILIWSLVFDTSMFWKFSVYFDFEGEKNICVL